MKWLEIFQEGALSRVENNVYKSGPLDIKTECWKECFSDPLSISNQVGMKYKVNRKNRYLVSMAMLYFFQRSTKVSAIYTRITQENLNLGNICKIRFLRRLHDNF